MSAPGALLTKSAEPKEICHRCGLPADIRFPTDVPLCTSDFGKAFDRAASDLIVRASVHRTIAEKDSAGVMWPKGSRFLRGS